MKYHLRASSFFGAAVLASGCLPAQLNKYRTPDKLQSKNGDAAAPTDEAPPGDLVPRGQASTSRPARTPSPVRASSAQTSASGGRELAPARATIYAVDKQTFRFALRENEVWDTALNVLLRNYNLTIVDRQSGIISTEWDSYYLNNSVYRNKLSLRVARVGSGVDLTIHNNVERLRDASQAAGTIGAVWLPAPDPANEMGRIVQNMALVLNQPPPVLPPGGALAKGGDAALGTATR